MKKSIVTKRDCFLDNTGGNWKNSIYITCRVCKYKNRGTCGDFLVSFDADGIPSLMTADKVRQIFNTEIDKKECLLEMSNLKFITLYDKLISKYSMGKNLCPLLQLI